MEKEAESAREIGIAQNLRTQRNGQSTGNHQKKRRNVCIGGFAAREKRDQKEEP